MRFLTCLVLSGQQHCRKNSDDGNNNQEFDKGETSHNIDYVNPE